MRRLFFLFILLTNYAFSGQARSTTAHVVTELSPHNLADSIPPPNSKLNSLNDTAYQCANTRAQFYIAEYNAVTTRCTYFITSQFVFWGVLVAFLTILILKYKREGGWIYIWGIVTGTFLWGLIASNLEHEGYLMTLYVEQYLIPTIKRDIMHNYTFWAYETFLANFRDAKTPEVWSWETWNLPLIVMFWFSGILWRFFILTRVKTRIFFIPVNFKIDISKGITIGDFLGATISLILGILVIKEISLNVEALKSIRYYALMNNQ